MTAATMDGFDPLAMPYPPASIPFNGNGIPNYDYMGGFPVFDMQDQYSNFDSDFRSVA
jgi:hypothetical protein